MAECVGLCYSPQVNKSLLVPVDDGAWQYCHKKDRGDCLVVCSKAGQEPIEGLRFLLGSGSMRWSASNTARPKRDKQVYRVQSKAASEGALLPFYLGAAQNKPVFFDPASSGGARIGDRGHSLHQKIGFFPFYSHIQSRR